MRQRHRQTFFPHQHTCGEPGCLKVFANNLELKRHARLAGHRPYRCECGYLQSDKWYVAQHVTHANRTVAKSIVHTQAILDEQHTCAEEGCHRVCSNGSKLQEHAKVTGHKAFRCVCGKAFSKLCSLSRHIEETRDEDGQGKYRCCHCLWGKSFKRLNHLEQHLKTKHLHTAEEVEAILLPFRKRKTRASKSALTTGPAAKQDAAQEGHSPMKQLDSLVGNTAGARTAFLAVTTSAIAPGQDASITALTDGSAGDLADLDARPVAFNLGAPMEDLALHGNNLSFQDPQWSNQFDFQTIQGTVPSAFPPNGLSSSYSACGGASSTFVTANLNSFMPSSQYGLTTPSMDSLAP